MFLLAMLAIGIAYMMTLLELKVALLIIGAILGIPIVILCFVNLTFGISVTLITAFMVGFVGKFTHLPIGIALDGLLFILTFGMLVNLSKERDFSFLKNPISIWIIIWIYYNFFQFFNPALQSKLAWIYTVRSLAVLHFLFFIACYTFKDLKTIMLILKVVIALGFISALYGLKQEFLGFTSSEMAWLSADEKRFQLIVQWNRFRIFSFFSDPTTYGILMSYMGVFCIVLATGPFQKLYRLLLLFSGVCMFFAMAYAGSRTPFVLVPAALILYTLLTLKKEMILATGILMVLGTAFVMKSTSSAVVYRIQSAFRPGDDASVQVRLENQKLIQPYIQTHPLGAGLGSTGAWGERFTPDSWLASFAHDSGYVRIATESGWIGLLIYMAFLFTVLKTSIYYYLRVRNPKIKIFYLAFTVMLFMLALASYPQEAIPILPNSIIFYISLASLVKLKDFDDRNEN